MRIPLTKYGWPEVVVSPAVIITMMIVCLLAGVRFLPDWIIYTIEVILAVILVWSLAFFRDPYRPVPTDKNVLFSPADGRITDIETIQENDFISSDALRIGIFLGIFDVHINRAPCNVKVERIAYKKGKYKNAANPQSGRVNESNSLELVRTDSPQDKLIVRQISGAIARRIVCAAREQQELTGGEKFGMIKFGSRAELYVPVRASSCVVRDASCEMKCDTSVPKRDTQYAIRNTQYKVKLLVKTGDKVKAGLTPLIRYE